LHTPAVDDANDTAKPESDDAITENGTEDNTLSAIPSKVTVCGFFAIVNDRTTSVAGK
jgi:hypothetical protein